MIREAAEARAQAIEDQFRNLGAAVNQDYNPESRKSSHARNVLRTCYDLLDPEGNKKEEEAEKI